MKKTFKFLADLKLNNEQEWFMDHICEYERAKTEISDFAYVILTQLSLIDLKLDAEINVERFISSVMNIRPKKAITYLGFFDISISPLANDGNEPVYLLHLDPDHSYISIKYQPDVFGLQVMRNFITKNVSELESILLDCYASGFHLEQSSMLATLPKGYASGMPGESLIKLKEYELRSNIDFLKPDDERLQDILSTFRSALPFVEFLRKGLGL